jgi:hypothetical protein
MTHRQFMQNPETERRIIYGASWLIAACVIAAVLTSCSPHAAMDTNVPSPAPAPSVTATAEGFEKVQNPTATPASLAQ